jgi:hypothetical protein
LDSMTVQDGVILYGSRTVIPARLRGRILDVLHFAHQGVTQMLSRAEISVFWPGLRRDIEQHRGNCVACRVVAPSNANLSPYLAPKPDYPFQQVCSDYF